MARTFSAEVPIRFSNCDPAGIVYFPEFFDLINSLVRLLARARGTVIGWLQPA